MIDENFVLQGGELPVPIPNVSMGAFCYQKMKSHVDGFVLMVEAISGRTITTYEFLQMSVNIADGLKAIGIGKGDPVCLIGRNGIEISTAALGILFIGGVLAPVDPCMKAFEYQHMINLIEPKLIICDADIVGEVQQGLNQLGSNIEIITFQENGDDTRTLEGIMMESSVENFQPEPTDDTFGEICIIVGSSGSTGLPKAVALTHSNMLFTEILSSRFRAMFPGSVFLNTSHFFWISGIFLFFMCICEGLKRVVVEEINDITTLKAIEVYKPSWTFMPPSQVNSLLHNPEFFNYDVSSMAVIITGGSPLQKSTAQLVKELWKKDMIIGQGYGLSEVSGLYLTVRPEKGVETVGSPSPGTSIKVIDVETGTNLPPGEEGELCCKTYGLMKCYIKNPEATKECIDEEGWFHTGDIGYFSEEGLVYITGRMKELMKLDNHQIAPAEIEQVINTVPGVADVGVAGIKVTEESCHPMALVVKEENSDVSEEEIVKCVNENLSEFKQLRAGVCFVDSIPRTVTGKIKRRPLQELADQLYMGDTDIIL